MDQYLEDICRRIGIIYDGSDEVVNKVFKWTIKHDKETAMALIFPGSPVLSVAKYYKNANCLLHYIVCVRDTFEIIEKMVNMGVDLNAKNAANRTVLDQACRFNKLEIAKFLLSRGAKVNHGDVSTLHYAIKGTNLDIVKLILEQGVDVNYRCAPEVNSYQRQHLYNYVRQHSRTPVEFTLDSIHQDLKCKDILEFLVEYGATVNVADPVRKETALHLAFRSNKKDNFIIQNSKSRPATINFLLRNYADVNALDSKGLVPLHYALRNYILRQCKDAKRNCPNRLKPDLVALIAFIAILIERREYVIEQNLALLEDRSARPIYEECLNELSLMKQNICKSWNFSFFNILFEDIQYWGSALKNEDIRRVLNSGEYKNSFPIYAEYLQVRVLEASISQSIDELTILLYQIKYM